MMYEMLSTFVHIVNSYDMQELHPEFAKHHLKEEEVTSALVSLRKPESHYLCELIARYTNLPELCLKLNKLLSPRVLNTV